MQVSLNNIKLFPLLAVVVSLTMILFFKFDFIKPLDNIIYDGFMSLKINNRVNKDIIIIKIDSDSISKLDTKRWPWNRTVHVKLLKMLLQHKPAVIGMNILFTDPTVNDKYLVEILKDSHNIVMAFANEKGSVLLPVQGILNNSIIADITVVKDDDGIVRYAYKSSSLGDDHYKSFASAVSDIFISV